VNGTSSYSSRLVPDNSPLPSCDPFEVLTCAIAFRAVFAKSVQEAHKLTRKCVYALLFCVSEFTGQLFHARRNFSLDGIPVLWHML
jgi:hypothetical protein